MFGLKNVSLKNFETVVKIETLPKNVDFWLLLGNQKNVALGLFAHVRIITWLSLYHAQASPSTPSLGNISSGTLMLEHFSLLTHVLFLSSMFPAWPLENLSLKLLVF